MKQELIVPNIRLGHFVHGGQVLAENPDGKKLFVWGGLPGELVDVRIIKKKSSYLEGIVVDVHEPSPDRVAAREPKSYLSTSPWQIVDFTAENTAKQTILEDAFRREGVSDLHWKPFTAGDQEYGYRNKLEIGFWGDDEGLHLAHYVRGTHGKQKVEQNALAQDVLNSAAQSVRDELQRLKLWAGDLKTLVVRCTHDGQVAAALFVKKELSELTEFKLPPSMHGMAIYFSDPRSPASVPTKLLHTYGSTRLTDTIRGKSIGYDVLSFFQVNLPVFEQALTRIQELCGDAPKVDMYSGVGAIGISLSATEVLVEVDAVNVQFAKDNVQNTTTKVVHASSETALEYIDDHHILIVDPPRAGLHHDVVDTILSAKPPKVVYLSCNPATQARDVALLQDTYKVTTAAGYNFFPRTPHIESLLVLELR